MNTKESLAKLLEASGEEFISGRAVAEQLGITRAAVWKNIRKLQEEGYAIEAVQNRGYRLAGSHDAVSEGLIRKYLGDQADRFTLEVHNQITSTNTVLKEKAADCPQWYTIVSGAQSAGRGRIGRQFFSPADSGVYLSVLLHPQLPAKDSIRITTAAAIAACRAIEECTEEKPEIKWVNDVFVAGRKVCGILTEGAINLETGGLEWAVMGIGLNVYEPEGGFPEELSGIAGPICRSRKRELRSALAGSFLKHFAFIFDRLDNPTFAEEYRSRCFLLGKPIHVLKPGGAVNAQALDIDAECSLVVRYEDGSVETLSSGEVSVRPL